MTLDNLLNLVNFGKKKKILSEFGITYATVHFHAWIYQHTFFL